MSTLLLDMGSGETCKNDAKQMCRMVDAAADLDRRGMQTILKWQLFERVPADVTPLHRELYSHAVRYAEHRGFPTCASVFDLPSLKFAEEFHPAWVKLACRPNLYWMHIYATGPVLMSVESPHDFAEWAVRLGDRCAGMLCCVPRYPAGPAQYERFGGLLRYGVSDHTVNPELAERWLPLIYECHFALPDQTGPDAGEMARRPEDVQAIIRVLTGG